MNVKVEQAATDAFKRLLSRGGGELEFTHNDLLGCMHLQTIEACVDAVDHLLIRDGASGSLSRHVARQVVRVFELSCNFGGIRAWLACQTDDDSQVEFLYFLWRALLKRRITFSAFCALVFGHAEIPTKIKVEFVSLAEDTVFQEGSHE